MKQNDHTLICRQQPLRIKQKIEAKFIKLKNKRLIPKASSNHQAKTYKETDWIKDNILNGIYSYWLRLTPQLRHYIMQLKRKCVQAKDQTTLTIIKKIARHMDELAQSCRKQKRYTKPQSMIKRNLKAQKYLSSISTLEKLQPATFMRQSKEFRNDEFNDIIKKLAGPINKLTEINRLYSTQLSEQQLLKKLTIIDEQLSRESQASSYASLQRQIHSLSKNRGQVIEKNQNPNSATKITEIDSVKLAKDTSPPTGANSQDISLLHNGEADIINGVQENSEESVFHQIENESKHQKIGKNSLKNWMFQSQKRNSKTKLSPKGQPQRYQSHHQQVVKIKPMGRQTYDESNEKDIYKETYKYPILQLNKNYKMSRNASKNLGRNSNKLGSLYSTNKSNESIQYQENKQKTIIKLQKKRTLKNQPTNENNINISQRQYKRKEQTKQNKKRTSIIRFNQASVSEQQEQQQNIQAINERFSYTIHSRQKVGRGIVKQRDRPQGAHTLISRHSSQKMTEKKFVPVNRKQIQTYFQYVKNSLMCTSQTYKKHKQHIECLLARRKKQDIWQDYYRVIPQKEGLKKYAILDSMQQDLRKQQGIQCKAKEYEDLTLTTSQDYFFEPCFQHLACTQNWPDHGKMQRKKIFRQEGIELKGIRKNAKGNSECLQIGQRE